MGSGSGLGRQLDVWRLWPKGEMRRYPLWLILGGFSAGGMYVGSLGNAGGASVVGWSEASRTATSSVSTASIALRVAGDGEL
jgi:hypothetical protein